MSIAAVFSLGAAAQPTVLKGKGITKEALIEALTPKPGDEGATGAPPIHTRSIKVIRENPSVPHDRLTQTEKRAQASILITFQTNSANLTANARSAVDVLAKVLQADKLADRNFIIEGHADPRGGTELNRKLSQDRAESVVAYLVTHHGIARERLKPVGKGDSELMNTKEPEAPENRRVTIIRE